MADGKKARPVPFSSKKSTCSWSPEKLPSQTDGCVKPVSFKKKYEPLTDLNKPEVDKGNLQKEQDNENVFTSSEHSEEKQISQSDIPDNLNQEMRICESSTKLNKAEADEGSQQKESDGDDVFMSGEATDEKQRPGSGNPASQSLNKFNRSMSVPNNRFHTLQPKRSSVSYETPRHRRIDTPSQSIDNLKEWRQKASEEIERNCEPRTEVNTAEADKENRQKEIDAEGDQPDSAPPALQSKPVPEVSDQPSRKCEPRTEVNTTEADKENRQKETGAEFDQQDEAPQTLKSKPVSEDQPLIDVVHEMIFRDLSEKIGREWEKLATFLGVSDKRLDHIKMNHPNNVEQQIYYMLMKWKSLTKNFGSSSFLDLADNLERVEQQRLAEELRKQFSCTPEPHTS